MKATKPNKYNVMGMVRQVDPDTDRYVRGFIDTGPCWTPEREAEMELKLRECDEILGITSTPAPEFNLPSMEVDPDEVTIDDEDWTEMEPTEAQLREMEHEFAM